MYVALTRAKFELYAFIPDKAGTSANLARTLITEPEFSSGSPVAKTPASGADKGRFVVSAPKYADMMSLLKDELPAPTYLDDRKKFELGDQLHEALSLIGALGPDADAVIKRAAKKAADKFQRARSASELEKLITELAGNPELRPIFYTTDAVYNEKEIILGSGRSVRIDRLLVGPEMVRIIDYKSSREGEEGHNKQVAEYAGAVKGIYPGRAVESYIVYANERKAAKVTA
jgi:ATP-dependent exoDNAse (exonuclease V) beta subunit